MKKRNGVPDPRKPSKFKGFRKPWRDGEPQICLKSSKVNPTKVAAAAFLMEGAGGAIRVLGSRAKFAVLSSRIKAQAELWLRAARQMDDLN